MRTTPTCTYDTFDLITFAYVIDYWLIDANTFVLFPRIATNVSVLKPYTVITELEPNVAIQVAYTYVSSIVAMLIMNPYETTTLM